MISNKSTSILEIASGFNSRYVSDLFLLVSE